MSKSIIIGAGKIGRGFIAQLLYISNEEFCFIEKSKVFAEMLNKAGNYHVYVLGNPAKDSDISGFKVYCFEQKDEIKKKVGEADCIFTSVGGKNLFELIPVLAPAIEARLASGNLNKMNIITCENWKQPAEYLRTEIRNHMGKYQPLFDECIGFTESVILRSGIENTEDTLGVNAQDYWELPVNAAKLKGELPKVQGFKPMDDFTGFLERKFYTYNAANSTVSYMGALMGYTWIGDAVYDEFIVENLIGIYEETSQALCRKQNYPIDEQYKFVRTSLEKMRNKTIVDTLERNARDPIRKLGPEDRLLGPAIMAKAYGIVPEHLCVSIAAAIYYENPSDRSAVELKRIREQEGIDAVLQKVCKLDKKDSLCELIKSKIDYLKQKGLIRSEKQ